MFASMSSSLHTDSDWFEYQDPSEIPKPPKKPHGKARNEVTETAPTLNHLAVQHMESISSSFEISSNPSVYDEAVIEDDSLTETHKISEANRGLKKRCSDALMLYKSVARPFVAKDSRPLFRINLLPQRQGVSQDQERSSESYEKSKSNLALSLRKIRKLKLSLDKRKKILETNNNEIKSVDDERDELKKKLDELSVDINGMAEARVGNQSRCKCALF